MDSIPWQPVVGEETKALLQHLGLPLDSASRVLEEAADVLSRCVAPTAPCGRETGLVIGYIQSGKTMSFTAVAALARDNGYRLIIVISGITTKLFEQSSDRLEYDLQLRGKSARKWHFLRNPKARPEVVQSVAPAIERESPYPGFEKQTVLITVMKNTTHLNNLVRLLKSLNLDGVPTIVIDDEGDQASLNTLVRQGDESATYRRIVQLQQLLPHHTFLQYTATPQALLLISIIDVLSPSFVVLLTPGPAYVGGKAFFEQEFKLVFRIPAAEIPSKDLRLPEPPSSLLDALRLFLLGVSVGLMEGGYENKLNRSMLVHPAKETMQHANYAEWIRAVQRTWSATLALSQGDPDQIELLEDFRAAYAELGKTVSNLPPFDEIEMYLPGAVNMTPVVEVNAARGKTPMVDWVHNYSLVVVGGEVLNRGYTVEGLTVTYMPRGTGVRNADTIQQRARWFGYKADYLGLCRVYLSEETWSAYVSYVAHEEHIRDQMRAFLAAGRSLRDWRRAFFLSPELRPTRHEVLGLDYLRGNYSNAWFETRAPHQSDDAVETNRNVVCSFLASLNLVSDAGPGHPTDKRAHTVARESLSAVYSNLLAQFRMPQPSDSQRFTGVLLQVSAYLEQNPNAACTVYSINDGVARGRGMSDSGEITNLFQGPDPETGERYPGDRHVRSEHGMTIQVHRLDIYEDARRKDTLVMKDVPALAVWIPREMAADWIVQDRQ